MEIRRAAERDIADINELLNQVNLVHHQGRPDIFKLARKYNDDQLKNIIKDDAKPIFVAVNEANDVVGYAFCMHQQHVGDNILTDIKTLYVDDICVSDKARGKRVGSALYEYVIEYAKSCGCYNVTLNVWSLNEGAMIFYEKCGMKPQKIGMEMIL